MNSQQKYNEANGNHIQHSKRLATWSLIQWALIAAASLACVWLTELGTANADVINGIVTWSATLAGVTITGYMGNSSIEKYAAKKFALTETTKQDEALETQG